MKDYKELLQKAKKAYENSASFAEKRRLETIFPELKEGEDEKIRKEIEDFIRWATDRGSITSEQRGKSNSWLAWLEKQGEQKSTDKIKPKYKVGDKVLWKYDKSVVRTISEVSSCGTYWIKCPGCGSGWWTEQELEPYIEQNKQEEQESTNKVEPKFKVGDWIICNDVCREFNPVLIADIRGDEYKIEYIDGSKEFHSINIIDRIHRHWTIEDAEDGDVLVHKEQLFLFKRMNTSNSFYAHCNYHFTGYDKLSFCDCSYSIDDIVPATKEQRELLFQKIKEGGYEWDDENKIIRKQEKPKFEWKDEDDVRCMILCGLVQNSDLFTLSEKNDFARWLDRLKERLDN